MNWREIVGVLLLGSLIFVGYFVNLASVEAQCDRTLDEPACRVDDQDSATSTRYPYPIPSDTITPTRQDDSYPVDMPATSTPRPTSAFTPVPQITHTPTPIFPTPTPLMNASRRSRLYLPSIVVESSFIESGEVVSVQLTTERVVGRNLSVLLLSFMIGVSGVTFVYVKR